VYSRALDGALTAAAHLASPARQFALPCARCNRAVKSWGALDTRSGATNRWVRRGQARADAQHLLLSQMLCRMAHHKGVVGITVAPTGSEHHGLAATGNTRVVGDSVNVGWCITGWVVRLPHSSALAR
jgi:hypothetical protein